MDKQELGLYVEKLQNGDSKAFNVIYDETKDSVYALLCSYTKNADESFDLMQETYITFNKKIGTLKEKESVKSWINRIAINKANRYFEKNKKEVLLSEEGQGLFEIQLEQDEEFLPQELLDSKEKQKIIKDIIDNLPLQQKTAVYLYYFDELSLAEVAEDMECSQGTVKSRLNYARKKIKDEVDTWEKKGTKLYSTGIPVLLLLLRNELSQIQMSLEQSSKLLKNLTKIIFIGNPILDNLSGDILHKFRHSIRKAVEESSKVAKIKAGIAGVAIIATLSSGAYIYNQRVESEFQGYYGWVQKNDKWYYIDENEKKVIGLFKEDGNGTFYFNRNGEMQTGWIKDNDGKWRYFDGWGKMVVSKEIDGYKIDSNGVRE